MSQKNTSAAKVPTETKPTPLVVGDNTAQLASLTESLTALTTDRDGWRADAERLATELAAEAEKSKSLTAQVATLTLDLSAEAATSKSLAAQILGLSEERGALGNQVDKLNAELAVAANAVHYFESRADKHVSEEGNLSPLPPAKETPRTPIREYSKAELSLADKLGVQPGHIHGINVERGVIVTIDGRKLGGAA